MARPSVMTARVLDKLEQAFALGCSDLEASLFANIAPTTLYNYQEKNPGFLERKEQLKIQPVLKARAAVVKSFASNPGLALKFLERKKKDEFGQAPDKSNAQDIQRPMPLVYLPQDLPRTVVTEN